MAATKTKVWTEEIDVEKKRDTLESILTEDRLSDLPEDLQLHILTFLEAKDAFQTTRLLSKTWVDLCTRIPVLNFNSSSFSSNDVFKRFMDSVLLRRDPLAMLEGLTFTGDLFCSVDTMNKVVDFALSHGVKHLEVSMGSYFRPVYRWPYSVCDSLTSLKLQTTGYGRCIRCPFLGPGYISLKHLAVLYLEKAIITDAEPFSGFTMLESLTLFDCDFGTENKTAIRVQINSLRLSDLTLSFCKDVKSWKLRTPNLRFLEYGGSNFPKHDGLPVLETLKIDFDGFSDGYYKVAEEDKELYEKRWHKDLLSLFSTVPNVKSLKLFSTIVPLLSLFPDELVRRGSPFQELKDLTLDSSDYHYRSDLFHKLGPFEYVFEDVKYYLLHNSPDAKFTTNGRYFRH